MNRLQQLEPSATTGRVRKLLDAVQSKLGGVPNLFRVLGNAPAALEGYLNLSESLTGGLLTARVREQIALAVAESNQCGYCLSAHTALGAKVGLGTFEMAEARQAAAADRHTDAVLKLAQGIVVRRGEISDAELEAARAAGLTDGEIVETVAAVALNVFTNYLNHVARTVVDFPVVQPAKAHERVACACA